MVDEVGWTDATKAKSKFGLDFVPPKRNDVKNLTPEQKKFLKDLLDRIQIPEDVQWDIDDLLNPPDLNKIGVKNTDNINTICK